MHGKVGGADSERLLDRDPDRVRRLRSRATRGGRALRRRAPGRSEGGAVAEPRPGAAAARSVRRVRAGGARRRRERRCRAPSARCAGWRTCWSAPASRAPWPACWSDSCGRAGSPSRSPSSRSRSSRRPNGRASTCFPGRAGLETLGDQVSAIVEKLEETDAALFDHRRRLVQSEKLSAVGELAAKLAHEVLNPLAGMKAAAQLLEPPGRQRRQAAAPVVETARALDREITAGRGAGAAPHELRAAAGAAVRALHRGQPGRRGAGGRRRRRWSGSARASSGAKSPICRRWRSIRSSSRRRWST